MKPYMKANMLAARTFLSFIEDCNSRAIYAPVSKRFRYPQNEFLPPMYEADFLLARPLLKQEFVRIIFRTGDLSSSPYVLVIHDGSKKFFKKFEEAEDE